MSFDILLQVNNSEENKIDKYVSTIATISGVLKEGTSIIDPVIIFEGDISTYKHANYMTISSFGRKYFITNIKSVRNNLFEISAHVDVLSSYASQIRANSGIVQRQQNANAYNLYLNDGTFRTYQNPHVLTYEFPNGFSSMEFVLAVAGS